MFIMVLMLISAKKTMPIFVNYFSVAIPMEILKKKYPGEEA
jgi:hypothetical protein